MWRIGPARITSDITSISDRGGVVEMYTSFTDWESGLYLEHYGIQGMKWGQRRFQNPDGSLTSLGKQRYGDNGYRSARGTKHDLNKLDRERSTAQARYDYYQGKTTKKLAKANQRLEKATRIRDNFKKGVESDQYWKNRIEKELGQRGVQGEAYASYSKMERWGQAKANKWDRKAERQQNKINKINAGIGQKAKDYKKLLDANKKMTERIINESVKKGYSIYSRDCIREVNRGRNVASGILAGLSAATLGIGIGTVQYAPGKHYRVRNDGLGVQAHRSRRYKSYATS